MSKWDKIAVGRYEGPSPRERPPHGVRSRGPGPCNGSGTETEEPIERRERMSLEIQASKIRDAMTEIDMEVEGTLHVAYSGRYMYGATCLGIVGGADTLMKFVADVIPRIDPGWEPDSDAFAHASEEWYELRWDNMAMDMIYYWPGVHVVEDDES